MQPEYETHNFAENSVPRRFEAVYLFGGKILVRISVYQRVERLGKGGGSIAKWNAAAWAWMPGTPGAKGDELVLCSLTRPEIVTREVLSLEATEEDWLDAARHDVETLLDRAQVYVNVLLAQEPRGRKRAAA